MKQLIFAGFALHRHLIQEIGWWVVENKGIVQVAFLELKEMQAFIGRQQELTNNALKVTCGRIQEVIGEEE